MADPSDTKITSNGSMDVKTDVEKKEDSGPSSSSASLAQGDKASGSPSVFGRLWNRLAELPEWGFRGQKLSGAVLNYSIGFIATCGFLMFVTPLRIAHALWGKADTHWLM